MSCRYTLAALMLTVMSAVAAGAGADGPVLHLDFEQDAGPQVQDTVSGQIAGHIEGSAAVFAAPGPRPDLFPGMSETNRALRFAQPNTQFVFELNLNDLLRGCGAVTLSAWVRVDQNREGQANLVTLFAGNASSTSFVLITENVGRSVVIGGRSGVDDRFAGARAPLHDEGWSHLVGILDFAHREARMYVNGKLESATPISAGKWANTTYQPPDQSDPAVIGSMGGHRYFHGDIDEVMLYPYALDDPDGDGGRSDSQVESVGQQSAQVLPQPLRRLKYNHPGLGVDLGGGLMSFTSPAVTDYDGDGHLDLILFCTDVPRHGTYLFRNAGRSGDQPLFEPPVRLGDAPSNAQASYSRGRLRVLTPAREYTNFNSALFAAPVDLPLPANVHDQQRIRANQWRYVDYDGDGHDDIVVGVGDWSDYGWDQAFNPGGQWTNGPLHGYVYLIPNHGTVSSPQYATPEKLQAGGAAVDVAGMPSPCFADFDGDGDLDLICGEFVDSFTYFQNVGTRTAPRYATGSPLLLNGQTLRVPSCMPVPIAYDWNGDGWPDLITTMENGQVLLIEHTGQVRDGLPQFKAPIPFRQKADDLKFGVLATPVSFDWNGDGREDLICGNAAGYIGFIENLDGGDPPKWAAPVLLEADGQLIHIQAGDNGSVQGPAERKWGYTTLSVADWDLDGLPDLIVNSIWGKVIWYRNVGTRTQPRLTAAQPLQVEWPARPPKPAWNWWPPQDHELVAQWRTTPAVLDLTGDGLPDLVMLDTKGFLVLFERQRVGGQLMLMPPRRIFYTDGPSAFDQIHKAKFNGAGLLQLNDGEGGHSGRRKFVFADWNGDGALDLLVNSTNVDLLRNLAQDDQRVVYRQSGPIGDRTLAGHTTSPTIVNWDQDGYPDLLIGAEDGCFYYLKNPYAGMKGEQP